MRQLLAHGCFFQSCWNRCDEINGVVVGTDGAICTWNDGTVPTGSVTKDESILHISTGLGR